MIKTTITSLIIMGLSAVAVAEEKPATAPAAGQPDMSKMGPLSRKVTKEDKKGVDELYKAVEDAMKKQDVNAYADLFDFPVIMLSDDSKGQVQHFEASREQFVNLMKGFMTQPPPKDMKHKHTANFLSDDLAVAIEEMSGTMGTMKGKWKAMSVLTLKDGKWKFKQIAEAGWGDMKPSTTAKK
jgi:uncharacterized protein (TIGR02246 family)